MVVQSDGYIVTNAHVVRNPMQRGKAVAADVVKVRTSDGKGYDAKVVGIDPTSDLAVLKVEAANLVPATFGDSENIQIGDWVGYLPHLAVVLIQVVFWTMKVLFFCWLQLLIRWTLPRFRPDQLLGLGWKKLLPLSLANIMITALVLLLWK